MLRLQTHFKHLAASVIVLTLGNAGGCVALVAGAAANGATGYVAGQQSGKGEHNDKPANDDGEAPDRDYC